MYGSACQDQVAHRRADVGDARAEVAVEEPTPEVEVLRPQRLVEPERLGEVAVQLLRGRRVGLQARDQAVDRVARHQPRDRPVDRHRHEEREEVDARSCGRGSASRVSGVCASLVECRAGRRRRRPLPLPRKGSGPTASGLREIDVLLLLQLRERVDARHVEVAVPHRGRVLQPRARGAREVRPARSCCTAPTSRCTRAGSRADPRGCTSGSASGSSSPSPRSTSATLFSARVSAHGFGARLA